MGVPTAALALLASGRTGTVQPERARSDLIADVRSIGSTRPGLRSTCSTLSSTSCQGVTVAVGLAMLLQAQRAGHGQSELQRYVKFMSKI